MDPDSATNADDILREGGRPIRSRKAAGLAWSVASGDGFTRVPCSSRVRTSVQSESNPDAVRTAGRTGAMKDQWRVRNRVARGETARKRRTAAAIPCCSILYDPDP